MKDIELNKDYFGYSQLISLALHSLPEGKQLAFLYAIEGYGFEQNKPDFQQDQELLEAWGKIYPNLKKGWKLAASGAKGGKIKAENKKAKAAKTESEAPAPAPSQFLSLPPDNAPTQKFADFIKDSLSYKAILEGAGALNAPQLRYLFNRWGCYASSWIIGEIEAQGSQRAGGVFELAKDRLEKAEAAFMSWHDANFPKLAKCFKPANKLTLLQYLDLRYKYGRKCVLIQLCKINQQRRIGYNYSQWEMLQNFIEINLAYPPSHPYHQDINDSPACLEYGFAAGYDAGFEIDLRKHKLIPDNKK